MISRPARVALVVLSALLLVAILTGGYWFGSQQELDFRARLAAGDTTGFESVREKALVSSRPAEIAACIGLPPANWFAP